MRTGHIFFTNFLGVRAFCVAVCGGEGSNYLHLLAIGMTPVRYNNLMPNRPYDLTWRRGRMLFLGSCETYCQVISSSLGVGPPSILILNPPLSLFVSDTAGSVWTLDHTHMYKCTHTWPLRSHSEGFQGKDQKTPHIMLFHRTVWPSSANYP